MFQITIKSDDKLQNFDRFSIELDKILRETATLEHSISSRVPSKRKLGRNSVFANRQTPNYNYVGGVFEECKDSRGDTTVAMHPLLVGILIQHISTRRLLKAR